MARIQLGVLLKSKIVIFSRYIYFIKNVCSSDGVDYTLSTSHTNVKVEEKAHDLNAILQ